MTFFRQPEGGKPTAAADAGGCQGDTEHVVHFAKIAPGHMQVGEL